MILFISSYNDILLPPISERLRALGQKITLENIPSIIGMDSNGWSFLWAKAKNPRGLLIEDWILENGFCVENVGTPDTFICSRARSAVDISLSSPGIEIFDWKIAERHSFSNHQLIEFSVNLGTKFKKM